MEKGRDKVRSMIQIERGCGEVKKMMKKEKGRDKV